MTVRRVVPDIATVSLERSREFYARLGLEEVMNLGWVMTLASPSNPTAQLTFSTGDPTTERQPDITIEVEDVDAVHDAVVAAGGSIVHTLRDEPWGVRRFFAVDPNGWVINIVSHLAVTAKDGAS
jgi:catechol 2,3-dioxygenase-like lactoylglutathione lyase family enzyme